MLFRVADHPYVGFLAAVSYVDAVATCASTTLLGSPATLMPMELVPIVLAQLSVADTSTAEALVTAIATTTAITAATVDQNGWDVWVWDRYRACRGANYIFESPSFFITSDVPCDWRLSFLCMEASNAEATGATLSTPWYERYLAAAAQPSTYQMGPSASGLQLVRSDLVLGSSNPPSSIAAAFDDAGSFWQAGPAVTALYRGGNHDLYALKPLHEDDGISGWAWARNQSLIRDFVGVNLPARDGGSKFEVYNMIAGAHDYIVSVQGCHNEGVHVERLLFVTRTGRQYQLGRGKCTTLFREDAPSGGYLAGFTGWGLNGSLWPAGPPYADEIAYIYQIRLVWAAPIGSASPRNHQQQPPALPADGALACPVFRPSAPSRPLQPPSFCGGGEEHVCPSNRCCGATLAFLAIADIPPGSGVRRSCGNDVQTCQAACLTGGFGLCGVLPEQPNVLFVRSELPLLKFEDTGGGTFVYDGSRTTLYSANRGGLMTYADAVSYCSSLSTLGLFWGLIDPSDALGLTASLDTRQVGYTTISGTRFWVLADPSYVEATPEHACVRGAYSIARNYDTDLYTHSFYPSSCLVTGAVICKASAAQNTTATATASRPWAPGAHTLSLSPQRGLGPLGNTCLFVLGAPAPQSGNSSRLIAAPLAAIRLSVAVMKSNESEHVELLVGLGVSYGGDAASAPAPVTAGVESTGGWYTLQLGSGEVVTAVSGCAGVYVERLVLHTSAGRLWTTPYGRMTVCTASFRLEAPPRGYLVGLQGYVGRYIESIQFVWGSPQGAPPPPPVPSGSSPVRPPPIAPPSTDVASPPPSTLARPLTPPPPPSPINNGTILAAAGSGSSGLAPGAIAGIAVGSGFTALLVLLGVVLVGLRVVRHNKDSHSGSNGKDGLSKAPAAAAGAANKVPPRSADSAAALATLGVLVATQDSNMTAEVKVDVGMDVTGGEELLLFSTDTKAAMGATAMAAPSSTGTMEQWGSDTPQTSIAGGSQMTGSQAAQQSDTYGSSRGPSPPSQESSPAADVRDAGRVPRLAVALPKAAATVTAMGSVDHGEGVAGPTNILSPSAGCSMDVVPVPRIGCTPNIARGPLLGADLPLQQLLVGRDVDINTGAAALLGRGATGAVRRGMLHTASATMPVAVKMLGTIGGGEISPSLLRMLAQEVHVLSRLDHPNVVRFYGACLDPQQPFLVQELMAMPLSKLIHGRTPEGQFLHPYGLMDVLRIARDIAAGLAYLHPTVVHRDLKPGNVLLDAEGRTAKIADFGLARFKQNTHLLTQSAEVGTTAYMAPELFMPNEIQVSDRADVYSYGMLVYELVTRQRPWADTRSAVIGYLVAIEWQRPPLPAPNDLDCPAGLRSLIERCWAHNPPERPSAAEIVKRLTLLLAEHAHASAAAHGSL